MRPVLLSNEEWKSYRRWIWFFLFFVFAYIVIELTFNAMLLNVSSGFNVDDQDFHRVELFGRLLASIGCTVSLFGLFNAKIRGSQTFTFKGTMLTFYLALVTIGPVFYLTTEVAIEEGLVKRSSAEDRYTAVSMDFEKRLHAAGFTDGFPYREEMMLNPHHPEAMTYLASYPLIGSLNDSLRADTLNEVPLETSGERLGLIYYTTIHARSSTNEAYASYQQYEPDLAAFYQRYLSASEKAGQAMRGISDHDFNQLWAPIREEVRSAWAKLEPYLNRERESMQRYIRGYASDYFYNLYQQARAQTRGLTLNEIEAPEYLERFKRRDAFGYRLEENTIGVVEKIEVQGNPNPYAIYCGGAGRIGRSCNPSRDQLFDFVWNWSNYDLYHNKKTGGYPLSVRTYQDFLAHKKTGQAVRDQIASEAQIYLGSSFDTAFRGSPTVTRRFIDENIQKNSLKAWRSEFAKSTDISLRDIDSLVPNMSFQAFIQVKGIARKITDTTGGFYSKKLALNMDFSSFYQHVMADVARTQYDFMEERYTRQPKDYIKKESAIEDGLTAYRMAIIPPIALMMSMFFSMVALLKLPLLINELVYAYSKGKHDYQALATWILALGVAIVIMTPFIITPLDDLAIAMRYDVQSLAQTSYTLALIQHWLYVVEPLLYGIGQGVLETTGYSNLEIVHHAMYPNIMNE
jgi:hypothetical protein